MGVTMTKNNLLPYGNQTEQNSILDKLRQEVIEFNRISQIVFRINAGTDAETSSA